MPIWLIQILVGIVLNVAGTLISSINKQDQRPQALPGVRGTVQTGGDHAPSFIIGRYGTAGKLKYAGTWGHPGGTPNAYYSKVIEVSYLPIRGFSGFFVNGERVTLDASPTGILGYAVLEYRVNGVDHLWITPYLGDQVAADPLMRDKFGSDPERPYTADMVGYGLGYFVATAMVNRELFPSFPEYLAEVDGIPLDDPRGDDAHDNPIVAAYTLLKGLYYDGAWVYGPQTYSDANFRLSNLETEADKCDAPIDLAGGGTMSRFRMGLEVALDAEPHAVVGELLKACQGRWADVGGVFKFLVGEPGVPVVGFTDEDIVITEQQTLEPFPGLESLFNGIAATYPEPAEAWETKEAPPRYRSDLEVADGRRLPFSTDYKAVPYGVQVQELMRAAIEETRRFRLHTQTMPPEWWEYEVLDVAAWSSEGNGYDEKQFLITAMEDLPNANQFVGLQEIDPADYGWDSEYELPFDVTPLVTSRPPPQVMTGWNVAPYVFPDASGTSRRIGIEVLFEGGLVDVRSVRVQVREDFGDGNLVFDGETPYDVAEASPSRAVTWAGIVPGQDYEVRGKYLPFSGRETEWSGWLGVTLPMIYIGLGDLSEEVNESRAWASRSIEQLLADNDAMIAYFADALLGGAVDRQTLRTEITARFQSTEADITAAYTSVVEVVASSLGALVSRTELLEATVNNPATGVAATATALSALTASVDAQFTATASAIIAVEASIGLVMAGGYISIQAIAAPTGWDVRAAFAIKGSSGGTFNQVGLYMDAKADGTSRIFLDADEVVYTGRQRSVNGLSYWDMDTGEFVSEGDFSFG